MMPNRISKGCVRLGVACALVFTAMADVPDALLDQEWYPKAPPLPAPTGQVIRVSNAEETYKALKDLQPGGTILFSDGLYAIRENLNIRRDNTTLRSASGDRTKVVLDFSESRHEEGISITNATGVTIASLTLQNVGQNGIKLNSGQSADGSTIYNVVSRNVWQRHIKGSRVEDKDGKPQWVKNCRVQFCLFYNDRPKQHGDEPFEDGNKGSQFKYNYIGGMDVMCADGWVISDNVFIGIHGKTGEGRAAIFMWQNSKNCTIERNTIIDCDAAIALGNSHKTDDRRHCTSFLVRNNFITRCPEGGIFADNTRDCMILNNTVHGSKRLLRIIHINENITAKNNILSGADYKPEGFTGKSDITNNLIDKNIGYYFTDVSKGNLHLTDKAGLAIDKASPLKQVEDDFDGTRRNGKPDLGADEFGN